MSMNGYDVERMLKQLRIISWCSEGHDQRIYISRPYNHDPDTVRVSIECIHCDEITVLEVQG